MNVANRGEVHRHVNTTSNHGPLPHQRHDRVAVIGLGRFGSTVALESATHGIDVLGVDRDPTIVQRLADRLPRAVTADATDVEALRHLGIPQFPCVVVAIGGDVEASILTTLSLVEFAIADVWAKAVSRRHGRILQRVGAHHVVLPDHEVGVRVARVLAGQGRDG
jgi:trk system potassium uptake protein